MLKLNAMLMALALAGSGLPARQAAAFALAGPGSSGGGASGSPWKEATGYEVSITGDPEMQARVFQSRDYQRLLVYPDRGDAAWLLTLVEKTVSEVKRDAIQVGSEGAQVDLSGRQSPRGSFARTGPEISFQVAKLTLHLAPQPPLVGEVGLDAILARRKDYVAAAKAYQPDSMAIEILKHRRTPVDVTVFFGTWCPSCKRWLPTFVRSIELAANPNIRVRYIAVDENYGQPRAQLKEFNVHMTPSFIVLVKGREVGRITGHPAQSVEKDLVGILASVK